MKGLLTIGKIRVISAARRRAEKSLGTVCEASSAISGKVMPLDRPGDGSLRGIAVDSTVIAGCGTCNHGRYVLAA
ncbi:MULTISPECIES: hypothetical protein [unclassified Paenibacillus]|uniref:hypothetical protein n=1 Tax=unclassified Paenibacillus TaxID=185978 RepID=UPI0011DD1CA3|nr:MULTISPECIES: hypothetical protein [unclassified Paenibacillus]